MAPTSYAEPKHTEAFMISEGPHTRSRDEAVILAGSGAERVLTAGMVIGKRLVGATASSSAGANNVGNGVLGTVTPATSAKRGRYTLTIVEPGANVGAFVLADPSGRIVGHGNVASAFTGELGFTLADGATDFVAGDFFNIDVAGGTEKWVRHDPAATTGEQVAAGILRADVTAPDGADAKGVAFVRDAEYNSAEVTYSSGANDAAKALARSQLAEVGLIAR